MSKKRNELRKRIRKELQSMTDLCGLSEYSPVGAALRGQRAALREVLKWMDELYGPEELKVGDRVKVVGGYVTNEVGKIVRIDDVTIRPYALMGNQYGQRTFDRHELEKL